MTLEELIKVGTAADPNNNATMAEAVALEGLLDGFLPDTTDVVVNTTTNWPANSALIPADLLPITADTRLNFLVRLNFADREIGFGVANLTRHQKNNGTREMVGIVLDVAVPGWKDDEELSQKVGQLPGLPPKPTVIVDPPSAPVPDWEQPFSEGHLATRIGDFSPNGTRYTSPAGVVWEKGFWVSPFTSTWKRV